MPPAVACSNQHGIRSTPHTSTQHTPATACWSRQQFRKERNWLGKMLVASARRAAATERGAAAAAAGGSAQGSIVGSGCAARHCRHLACLVTLPIGACGCVQVRSQHCASSASFLQPCSAAHACQARHALRRSLGEALRRSQQLGSGGGAATAGRRRQQRRCQCTPAVAAAAAAGVEPCTPALLTGRRLHAATGRHGIHTISGSSSSSRWRSGGASHQATGARRGGSSD